MARILKNKTDAEVMVTYGNTSQPVAPQSEYDLSLTFEAWQLASSPSLFELIGQGVDKYQLNDGVNDLTVLQAIDLLKGILPSNIGVTISGSDKIIPVSALPPVGLKSNQISPNWCDKTTWWYSATPVQNEIATTTDPERKVWSLIHQNVIDVFHGKLTGEDSLPERRVLVVSNGVTLLEKDPDTGIGDFLVDYAAGTLTFDSAIPVGQEPVVSYYYENGSLWIIAPSSDETWRLKGAEAQFSDDVVMTDTMTYEVWAYNPEDMPNKVMVVAPDYYKSITDYVNDSNKAYPPVPAIGGSGWRGNKRPVYVFAWDFQTTTDLIGAYGMELHVRLLNNRPFTGTFSTGTFYFIRDKQ